jgi:SecD/SecF fusion protein
VTAAEGQQIVVPQGTVVLQASNPSATDQIKFKSPSAQFYVLRDHVSLTGSDITNPQPSTDSAGSPDVRFGLDSTGQATFTKVTGEIARRGDSVSSGSQTLNQHFAVALDQQLITVPSIDFKVYPDGITGGGGADLSGDFTTQSARTVATLLRYRALTVELVTH